MKTDKEWWLSFQLPNTQVAVVTVPDIFAIQQDAQKDLLDACNEAWNAFENGKRKHHRDALTGKCILGCQACAIEKLKLVINGAKLEACCTPEIVAHYESLNESGIPKAPPIDNAFVEEGCEQFAQPAQKEQK